MGTEEPNASPGTHYPVQAKLAVPPGVGGRPAYRRPLQ